MRALTQSRVQEVDLDVVLIKHYMILILCSVVDFRMSVRLVPPKVVVPIKGKFRQQ